MRFFVQRDAPFAVVDAGQRFFGRLRTRRHRRPVAASGPSGCLWMRGTSMARLSELMNRMIPISVFSRGGSAKAFDMVETGKPVIVLRNNSPIAVLVTPAEYDRMQDAVERLAELEAKE